MVDDRRAQEIAVLAAGDADGAAVDEHGRPRRFGFADVARDTLLRFGGDHWPEVAPRNHPSGEVDHAPDNVIGLRDRDHHRRRHAALSRASRHRRNDVAAGHLRIGVGHDDEMILCSAERETALQIVRRAAIDDFRDLRRSDEADGADARVVADRFDRVPAAVHHLKHAVGKARFLQQLGDAPGAERNELARFQDHAVTKRERVRDRPVRHHIRKIEWRNRRHDADRESFDATLDAAAHLEHFARDDLRQRARELGELSGLQDLRPSLARDLSILLGDERAQLVDVLLEERFVAIEDLDAFLDRRS